jgi:hypothetical protein
MVKHAFFFIYCFAFSYYVLRQAPYMDFFNYIDSVGGFWLYRWGDHSVRTLAIAFHLDEKYVFKMDTLPYGHQEICKCGKADMECRRIGKDQWWECAKAL